MDYPPKPIIADEKIAKEFLSKETLTPILDSICWNDRMVEDEEGVVFKSNGISGVVCTGYARDLAEDLLPMYLAEDNTMEVHGDYFEDVGSEDCELSKVSEGHDVCIVNRRFVIDPWPKEVRGRDYPVVYDWEEPEDQEKLFKVMGHIIDPHIGYTVRLIGQGKIYSDPEDQNKPVQVMGHIIDPHMGYMERLIGQGKIYSEYGEAYLGIKKALSSHNPYAKAGRNCSKYGPSSKERKARKVERQNRKKGRRNK